MTACYQHRLEDCLRCALDRLWELYGHDPVKYQYEVWTYMVRRREQAEDDSGEN